MASHKKNAPDNPRRLSELGGLRAYDPKAWAKIVKAAMREASGNRTKAAEALGISWRQLVRWLDDPLLEHAEKAKRGRPKAPDES